MLPRDRLRRACWRRRAIGSSGLATGREAAAEDPAGRSLSSLSIDVLFPGEGTLQAVVEWSRTPGRGRILGLCRFSRILPDYYLLLTGKLGMRVILSKPFDRACSSNEAIDEVAPPTTGPNWRGSACTAVA